MEERLKTPEKKKHLRKWEIKVNTLTLLDFRLCTLTTCLNQMYYICNISVVLLYI